MISNSTMISLVVTIGLLYTVAIVNQKPISIPVANGILFNLENKDDLRLIKSLDNDNNYPSIAVKNLEVVLSKSFKNGSGFYKLQGKFENHGYDMNADIDLVKYYKEKWRDNITQICYVQKYLSCEFKER